jgi:iron complex outermembrane receptor protein
VETRFLNPIDDWSPSPRPEDLPEPSLADDRETKGKAYYFVDQVVLMDEKLRIIFGARYEEYETHDYLSNRSGEEADWTYQGGAMYALTDWLSAFGSYSQSFYRNEFYGQFGPPGLSGQLAPPQQGEGIDFGLKWETSGGRFAGTLSYFDLSQSDILVNTTDNGSPVQVLAGERTSEGVELDLHFAPVPSWQIIVNYAYTKAEDVATGQALPNVPEQQASIWTRYEFTEGRMEGLFVGGGARYLGDRPAGSDANLFEQSWSFDAEGYVHVDVFAGKVFDWRGHQLRVQFNVTNLTDEAYIRGGQTLPSEPRRYMVSLKTTW